MYIHKEGYKIIAFTLIGLIALISAMEYFIEDWNIYWYVIMAALIIIEIVIICFFRIPKREMAYNPHHVIASADGTIVVVEQTFESEFLKTDCIQISTFMSPTNVHVNRYPISGKVIYTNYHSGKYLIARYPKSSTLNERTTICIESPDGKKVLVRQIAGALARRIVCYAVEGEEVKQGSELGFIKFGSRVDLFIPIDSNVHAELEDKVKGGLSVLATF
ncbi:MAG: phosphatidylserine decarboxylase family protein [Bacteroidales bacterium]|jgi:phosphatidylserine decarboxylase|nr:phosphatidylserine decarboxylase family protein [Bacteroidales bacterium]